jgi:hypothetical protein
MTALYDRTSIVSKSAEEVGSHAEAGLPVIAFSLIPVIAFSLFAVLLALNGMLRFHEFGAIVALYNQF